MYRFSDFINNGLPISLKEQDRFTDAKESILFFLKFLEFPEYERIKIATLILEFFNHEYSSIKMFLLSDKMLILLPEEQGKASILRYIFKNVTVATNPDNEKESLAIEINLPKIVSIDDQELLDIKYYLNSGLSYGSYIESKIQKRDATLQQNLKMAMMGEMIANIAHQWRQPLNQISLLKDILVEQYYFKELTDDQVDEFREKMNDTLRYMSHTIDDFRNFFLPKKEKEDFDINLGIKSAINIINASIQNNNIELNVTYFSDKVIILGYSNEFTQVIINLISNSKDAILSKRIDNGKIDISLFEFENSINVQISDNGGGIPSEIIDRIFEPYFTTKFSSKGTGLGLYMSQKIIQGMNGTIHVKNSSNGAVFTIELEKRN